MSSFLTHFYSVHDIFATFYLFRIIPFVTSSLSSNVCTFINVRLVMSLPVYYQIFELLVCPINPFNSQ